MSKLGINLSIKYGVYNARKAGRHANKSLHIMTEHQNLNLINKE